MRAITKSELVTSTDDLKLASDRYLRRLVKMARSCVDQIKEQRPAADAPPRIRVMPGAVPIDNSDLHPDRIVRRALAGRYDDEE